eukprot:TRINITY_DN39960_c0_g1_i1.p1 TRINITY_DN39960_c0_g1~~TRINITY_DN39960_c0_g1_i1.p1  ORF type:complete len:333 (-),score=21.20 TRINITY_DN39960_c0_g1_i1:261-1259(-)
MLAMADVHPARRAFLIDSVAVSAKGSPLGEPIHDVESLSKIEDDGLSQTGRSSGTERLERAVSKRRERLQAAAARSSGVIGTLKVTWGALSVLLMLRGVVLLSGVDPRPAEDIIMLVPLVTDMACLLLASPVVLCGMFNCCLTKGFLGPAMTLCATMLLSDIGSFISWIVMALPQATEGFGLWSLASPTFWSALLGPWEACLCSSVALESALCVCLWRTYQTIRLAGAYPVKVHACPGPTIQCEVDADSVARDSIPLLAPPADGVIECEELFCEPNDARLLGTTESGPVGEWKRHLDKDVGPGPDLVNPEARPVPASQPFSPFSAAFTQFSV